MADTFPPLTYTTLTKVIPSYLYVEYNDDEDLQAFVRSFNTMAQHYVDWFASIGLPFYPGANISSTLLDWVAQGLYGMSRPALPSGQNQNIGPLNTWTFNSITLNTIEIIGNQDYYATTDDVFKRILTWHLYKGDGKVFSVRWLKRRIMRFLTGTNGMSPNIDQTYQVSVTFGIGNQVNIDIINTVRTATTTAILNGFQLNQVMLDQLSTTFTSEPAFALAPILVSAIEAGVLELPFQFEYVVTIT